MAPEVAAAPTNKNSRFASRLLSRSKVTPATMDAESNGTLTGAGSNKYATKPTNALKKQQKEKASHVAAIKAAAKQESTGAQVDMTFARLVEEEELRLIRLGEMAMPGSEEFHMCFQASLLLTEAKNLEAQSTASKSELRDARVKFIEAVLEVRKQIPAKQKYMVPNERLEAIVNTKDLSLREDQSQVSKMRAAEALEGKLGELEKRSNVQPLENLLASSIGRLIKPRRQPRSRANVAPETSEECISAADTSPRQIAGQKDTSFRNKAGSAFRRLSVRRKSRSWSLAWANMSVRASSRISSTTLIEQMESTTEVHEYNNHRGDNVTQTVIDDASTQPAPMGLSTASALLAKYSRRSVVFAATAGPGGRSRGSVFSRTAPST